MTVDDIAGTWTERDIARFQARVPMFMRRGVTEARAEQIAERLVLRDRERDDRRMCIECAGLQRPLRPMDGRPTPCPRCGPAARGLIKGPRLVEPVIDLLQRCPHFSFAKP